MLRQKRWRLVKASAGTSQLQPVIGDFPSAKQSQVLINGYRNLAFCAWKILAGHQDDSFSIVHHMNADHGDALKLLAGAFAGIESQEVTMTSVDRLGFHVRLKTADGPRGARIAFSREVSSPAKARSVLIEMVAQARQR